MAMITDLLAALGAAVAAFFGHIAAHDFVEFTPKMARSLIRRATKFLPKRDRRRYREEWMADLQERVGVFAKLRHAFGCVRSARKMQRQSEKHVTLTTKMRLELSGIGAVECDATTAAWAALAMHTLGMLHPFRQYLNSWVVVKLAYYRGAIKLRSFGQPDASKMKQFMKLMSKIDNGVEVKLWSNGKLVHSKRYDLNSDQD